MSLRRTSIAIRGLLSTRLGKRFGVRPDRYAKDGSRSSSESVKELNYFEYSSNDIVQNGSKKRS